MRRLLIILFALILSACGSAPTGFDWCYTYDLSNPYTSNGHPFVIHDGTITGAGIQSVNGDVDLEGSAWPLLEIIVPNIIKYELVINNPGAPFTGDWGIGIFRSSYGDVSTIPSGVTTLYADPNNVLAPDGYLGASMISSTTTEYTITSATVYGTNSNPYPRNDCAAPTATPPAATSTPGAPTPGDGLIIPIDSAFTSLNDWINLLAPIILFIGMIPVALALLAFIVNQFKSLGS